MSVQAPPPARLGSRIRCPMVDQPETERTGELVLCDRRWPGTPKGRKQYRRHWRRAHWAPFMAETNAVLRFLTKGDWAGFIEVNADVKVVKGNG